MTKLDFGVVDPDALNDELSDRLEHCVLVCELDLDEQLHGRLIKAMELLHERRVTTSTGRLRGYSALVATYLVAEGIFNFAQGTFFPNLSVKGLDRNVLTTVFEHALRIHGLEKFRALVDAGAQRYLTPILAHGGIPKYSLSDFFRLVTATERRGAADASEMLAYWREHPSLFANTDKPVERFLLYGGDISHDFLDRCLDLVFAQPATEADIPADGFALPRYVCDTFLQLEPDERRLRHGATSDAGIPRPLVIIDPWDTAGPMLVLPSVPGNYLNGSWDVIAQDHAIRHPTSRMERIVALAPARRWSVECRGGNGLASRTFTFAGLARAGVLLFDYSDHRLISDFARLRDSRVWILHSGGENGSLYRQSGENLQPIETAPQPSGLWGGYVLEAFDLADSERILVGKGKSVEDSERDGTSFWVRIRGDRISLDIEPVPGVHSKDGLPVYAAAPSLLLPGFDADASSQLNRKSTAWSARIQVNGIDHEFDAPALAQLRDDVIRSVLADGTVARVQVTARGPLGMDMRAEFCIIPGLSVSKPANILLPTKRENEILGYVTTSWQSSDVVRIPIHASEDVVDARFKDLQGHEVETLITVPCLQWAFISSAGMRSELGQHSSKLSASELVDGDALLVIRTRQAGLRIELMLRERDDIVQTISAQTAGVDGRWAFDLRPFSDSIRSSSAARLDLVLKIAGYDVVLGFVQAELNVQHLSIRQRSGNGDCTLVLSWEQVSRLNGRVARFWSLSMPWRAPVVEPIPDHSACEISVTRPDAELPPGLYLGEIAVDDGWASPQMPSLNASSARQFRLGSEDDQVEWLRMLPANEPEIMLTLVAATGNRTRQLTATELEIVAPLALEALYLSGRQQYPTVNHEGIAELITAKPSDVIAGVHTAALNWSNNHVEPFLTSVLPLLSALHRWAGSSLPAGDTTFLWELCPSLAAVLDLLNIGNPQVQKRFELESGSTLNAALSSLVIPETRGRVPQLQPLIGRSADSLEELRRQCFLLPKQPLDLDTQVAVQLEWLIADKRGQFSSESWVKAHRKLGNQAGNMAPGLFSHFAKLCAPDVIASSLPMICFPETVYVAALHVVTNTKSKHYATLALNELIPLCPGIVSRSLILAAVHTYSLDQSQ